MAGFRAAPFFLVGGGQSLNNAPTPATGYLPRIVTALVGDGYVFPSPVNASVNNMGWFPLEADESVRVHPYAHAGLTTIYLMNGGTTDIPTYTAANIFDKMVDIATAAKSAGFDIVVNTTVCPNEQFEGTPAQEAVRDSLNTLILASDAIFDDVVDLAATTGLDDSGNATYYSDGIHWTAAAAQIAADTTAPVLAALLGA